MQAYLKREKEKELSKNLLAGEVEKEIDENVLKKEKSVKLLVEPKVEGKEVSKPKRKLKL